MGAGECGKYQLSCIRMTRVDGHLGTALVYFCDLADILNLQLRVDALGEHVVSDV